LKAALGMNRGGDPEQDPECDLAKAGRLISRRRKVAVKDLADEEVDLESIGARTDRRRRP